MKSKYSHLVVLAGAVMAFVPVFAVDYLLDTYVGVRETHVLQRSLDSVTSGIQASADDAIASLRQILADSASLCTPSFMANVHKQMESSPSLRQVLVESTDGTQFCDAFGHKVQYSVLSKSLSIPGHSERVTLVRLGGMPVLKISQRVSANRRISTFVPVLPQRSELLQAMLNNPAMLNVALTDGTPVHTVGDPAAYERRQAGEFISAQSFAGALPLRSSAAVPFDTVRADYAVLDIGLTIAACVMAVALWLLGLQFLRRSQLPAFDLEWAISKGELKPYYQPVINLSTGRVAGCEVLCRWEKPNGDVVMPGGFIDYAELTGLAVPMTLSLMQQVRDDLSDLCAAMPELRVSINLFEGHFRDTGIVDDVQAIFGDSGISFSQLTFEITERRPLEQTTQTHTVISGLHALGVKLAMDDVGTGHSNLAYMQTLGVDVIKIDRVFVDMISAGTSQIPVLDGLIAMARDLKTQVIAEGVETTEQALYLRARGVVLAQGFLFSPAVKPESFLELARALNDGPEERASAA